MKVKINLDRISRGSVYINDVEVLCSAISYWVEVEYLIVGWWIEKLKQDEFVPSITSRLPIVDHKNQQSQQ